jgi:hypothetical protein
MGLLTEVLLRGLPTRDDRLQEDCVRILDERHPIYVVLSADDENASAARRSATSSHAVRSRTPLEKS